MKSEVFHCFEEWLGFSVCFVLNVFNSCHRSHAARCFCLLSYFQENCVLNRYVQTICGQLDLKTISSLK